ncbi:MAG TPA: sodium:solute symporter family protein [Opitutaceae bacterium]|nr:sodium:solute symporter family protein [Opitutaceae bacterium]
MQVTLTWLDYLILLTYTCFVVGIGFALRKYMKSSSDFLTSGRSIPTWVTGLAFISANLGALELVGMAASGAKYGNITSHFYWVGAIPAMVFLAVFMMPFYYGSRARSVPEYLKMRFDERVRALNSVSFSVMTVFASGISMNALAKLLHLLLGWNYHLSLWICSAVVLVYVLKGGLTSAIYTEVLQFFMIVLGFAPVVYLGLKDVGGYGALTNLLKGVATNPGALHLRDAGTTYNANAWTSIWQPLLAGPTHNPMGVDWFAMVFGLGFVLSFGYWCTNFLVVQRAMAARNMTAARNTPLVAAVPKMLFPALVILPGMIAVALMSVPSKGYRIPAPILDQAVYARAATVVAASAGLPAEQALKDVSAAVGKRMDPGRVAALVKDYAAKPLAPDAFNDRLWNAVAEYDYDGVILSLVKRYCPPGLLGLALTGLLASFMSGMAGNVTAFNTVWTYDLYQAYLAPKKSDEHYMRMGQAATLVGILASIACAYFAALYNNAMDIIQLVFAFVNAPLFATFLLGMFWARTTGTGAFLGLLGGTAASGLVHALTISEGDVPGLKGGYLGVVHTFPSEMAQNFWLAVFAFVVCFTLTVGISLATRRTKSDEELGGLVYSLTPKIKDEGTAWYGRPAFIGTVLLAACAGLNIIFW